MLFALRNDVVRFLLPQMTSRLRRSAALPSTPRRRPRGSRSSIAAVQVRFAAEATAERHSSHVLPLCAEALRAVGITPVGARRDRLRRRAGQLHRPARRLAVAKGLALPTRVPFLVVSSLEALALDILDAGPPGVTAVPCLDAGKGEVYIVADVRHAERLVREVARTAARASPPARRPVTLAAMASSAP